MSTLLYSLGRWSYRHGWRVLVSWIVVLIVAGGGAALFGQGTDNSFSIPGTESEEGLQQLSHTFPQVSGTSAQIIVVAAPGAGVGDDPYRGDIEGLVDDLEGIDGVLAVTDPFSEVVSGQISDDGTAAIVRLQFEGQSTSVSPESKRSLQDATDAFAAELPDGAQAVLGGDLFANSVPGLTITEAVGLIIALLVLLVTFRSFVMAGLPLLTAIIGVGLSMALILVATVFTSISATTPLLALMLGLAVGIDYALFIAARHQDQVRAGVDPEESAARATGTAGSAVVFAGVTVLIALIGLSFANIPFLTTMGIAAALAVAIAVLVAVTLTPALLGLVKRRAAGGRRAQAAAARAAEAATPVRVNPWVRTVSKHPIVATIAVVVGLGVLAIPASSLALALPNAGVLPTSDPARQTYDLTAEHFGPGANGPLIMTGTIVTSTDPVGLMNDLADDIRTIPGVEEIALATPNETADTGIVQIVPETAPDDPATAELVRELRAQHDRLLDEYGIDLKVTGFTAVGIDISDRLGSALVPFGLFVVGLSFLLLMVVFRSIAVPLTAALGYLLSVAAAFGVVAAVFEWGWFADLLHVTRVGPVISFMPIVLMGVLFGLAMDYQVFLVTRMREDYVHARAKNGAADARALAVGAVRSGFSATARVVTAAALIMFAVFAAFVPEGDSSIKPIALGLAVGIAVDAFLVRMTLIPALMTLLGDKAWWMPRWLDRLLPKLDVEGEAVERELALHDWPGPDSRAIVVADGVGLRVRDVVLFDSLSVEVDPGGALVLTSTDPRRSRGALYALTGRTSPTSGRLRVDGHLLPGREAWVRGHVAIAQLDAADDPLVELRRALGGPPGVVALEAADVLAHGARRDQAAAMLRDARARGPWTLLVTASDPAAVERLLTDAGWPDPAVRPVAAASRSSHASEVIA